MKSIYWMTTHQTPGSDENDRYFTIGKEKYLQTSKYENKL